MCGGSCSALPDSTKRGAEIDRTRNGGVGVGVGFGALPLSSSLLRCRRPCSRRSRGLSPSPGVLVTFPLPAAHRGCLVPLTACHFVADRDRARPNDERERRPAGPERSDR